MSQTRGGNYKKRILAVDDTAIVLTRISNTLRDDYDVITVNSGVRALVAFSFDVHFLISSD